MTPQRQLALGLIALFAGFSVAGGAPAASPLDDLVAPKPGNRACFARIYDAAHLRNHPKQTTQSITVLLTYRPANGPPDVGPDLGIAITRKGDPLPFFAQGGCSWDDKANRDTSDQRMIEEFKKEAGGACMMLARPDVFDVSSAEEGGFLIIDRGKDANTLMVYLSGGLVMVKMADRAKQLDVNLGAEDSVFLLHRIDLKVCDFVGKAMSR